jgi:tetratricopeptide (TPR) repeat protein/outer membrane protein OmpA-like peptidoglycan-associated protein
MKYHQMKFNIKILLVFLPLLLLNLTVYGQTKKAFIKEAELNYINKNFYAALVNFERALEFDENDTTLLIKAAESARQFDSYAKAAKIYSRILDSMSYTADPNLVFHLATMYQKMGKYDEAERKFQMFKSAYENQDSFLLKKTEKELASIAFAKTKVKETKSTISVERMENNVNTPYSEVGAIMYRKGMIYSSKQFEEVNKKIKPPRKIAKLMEKPENESPKLLESSINKKNESVTNPCFSPDGKYLYYTVCKYVSGSEKSCDLYKASIDAKGNISGEQRMPEPINIVGYTTTHPNVVYDNDLKKEILYFVSDRTGGSGGLDIWYSVKDEKYGFSQPVNIKELNTPDNEVTPFYHDPSGYLYFSTDGRFGLGGFDVFKTQKTKDGFSDVVDIGMPVNSSYHDLYFHLSNDGDKALMSSNREGSLFLDSYYEACCFDIYDVTIKKLKLDLLALTFDKITGRPLKRATVRLIDKKTGVEVTRNTNELSNDHTFELLEDRNYLIVAERENYFPDTLELSTFQKDQSELITKKLYLSTDMMLLDVNTFTKVGKLPLSGVTVTIIDLTDTTKKHIVEYNPLSHEFNFMIDRGKQYKIIATKDGFTQGEDIIDTRPYDKSGLIQKDIFLDKFVLQDLLPIALYFDNDLPDRKSKNTTTKAVYGNLVNDYVNKKQEYKNKFAKPLQGDDRSNAENDIDIFFEGNVMGGYEKLKMFIPNLIQELEAGNKVELIFKGFASPRAESKYNLALGQRRVNSVKNEMVFFGNEELKKYFLSGQLVITDISFGKELAPADVEGKISDERNSIYNLKAARERRVEILRAKRN